MFLEALEALKIFNEEGAIDFFRLFFVFVFVFVFAFVFIFISPSVSPSVSFSIFVLFRGIDFNLIFLFKVFIEAILPLSSSSPISIFFCMLPETNPDSGIPIFAGVSVFGTELVVVGVLSPAFLASGPAFSITCFITDVFFTGSMLVTVLPCLSTTIILGYPSTFKGAADLLTFFLNISLTAGSIVSSTLTA